MKVDEPSIKDWLSEVRNSKVALPRFQRHEEWSKTIIENFLTSIVQGLPTGAALVYDVRGKVSFKYRYLTKAPKGDHEDPNELILDGQQRLTAVWKSLNNFYKKRKYLVDFNNEEELRVISRKRFRKEDRKDLYPLWVDDPKKCWKRNKVPINVLNPDQETTKLMDWVEEATSNKSYKATVNKLVEVRDTIGSFTFPKMILEDRTDPSHAIEVFIQLNTSYVSLSSFDIVVAKTEAETRQSLHKKKEELISRSSEIKQYKDPEKYILNTLSLLQSKRATKTNKEEKLNYSRLMTDWDKLTDGTERLLEFLEQERIYNGKKLPTNVILAPLAALLANMPTHPDRRGNVKRLLKKYLWRSFFTDRYETTTNERIYNDYIALKERLNGENTHIPCFNDENHPIPTQDDLLHAGWPTKKNRLARAILAITFKFGAKNFSDDDEINRKNIEHREYHHLYPKSYLRKIGFSEEESNKALNCALISWKDNRNISSKDPLQYLLERSEADDLGEEQIKKRLKSHLVDYDQMVVKDYEEFLAKRASDILFQAQRLCNGKDIKNQLQ